MEEENIIQAILDFSIAWNNGDAKTSALFFAEEGKRVGALGDIQQGRNEIEQAFKKLFSNSMPRSKIIQERGSVRMLTDNLAIWQGSIKINTPDDCTINGYVIQVMKKENQQWLILESHPKFFPFSDK